MPPANKLIQAKIEARNRKILKKRVKDAKGVVDVSAPESFRYARVNAKKVKVGWPWWLGGRRDVLLGHFQHSLFPNTDAD